MADHIPTKRSVRLSGKTVCDDHSNNVPLLNINELENTDEVDTQIKCTLSKKRKCCKNGSMGSNQKKYRNIVQNKVNLNKNDDSVSKKLNTKKKGSNKSKKKKGEQHDQNNKLSLLLNNEGCFHLFKSKSSSSQRTQIAQAICVRKTTQMTNDVDAVINTKSNVRKIQNTKRKYNLKMQKLDRLKETRRTEEFDKKLREEIFCNLSNEDMENHACIFLTWINDPNLFFQMENLREVMVNTLSMSLRIEDTVNGSKMSGMSKYIPTYILVPRDDWLNDQKQPTPERDVAVLQNILDDFERKGIESNRGEKTSGISEEYAYFGVTAKLYGTGTSIRHPICPYDVKHAAKMLRRMQHMAYSWLPFGMSSILKEMKQICNEKESFDGSKNGQNEIWASMATSYNYISPAHTDDDAFFCCLTVSFVPKSHTTDEKYKYEKEQDVALYFCFPSKGFCIALRPGDVLFFNPKEYHCVSQRTEAYKNERVYTTSFYYKSKQLSLNNNSIPIGDNIYLDNLN